MSDNLLPARFLTRTEAAAYLGVSARTFDAEVHKGLWPPPLRRGARGGTLTWDRKALDCAADRIGGLASPEGQNSLASAEQAALEAASRGTPSKNRAQHGHAKAG